MSIKKKNIIIKVKVKVLVLSLRLTLIFKTLQFYLPDH